MPNSEHQPKVEKNLEALFDMNNQADNQLIDVLSGNDNTELNFDDYKMRIEDVRLILSSDNKE